MMEENITTTLRNHNDEAIIIDENYSDNDFAGMVMITIGEDNYGASGKGGDFILLNKNELECFIEKLQFYCSRMKEYDNG